MDVTGVKSLGETEEEHNKNLGFIYKFIIEKFGFLTLEEVKEAFKMYVAKEFDIKVFRILDCVVIAEVLYAYIDWRNEKIKSIASKEDLMKLEVITQSAKEDINKSAVNRVFREFLEEKTVPDSVGYIYDTLVESGLIKLANENTPKLLAYYDKIMVKAKSELIIENQCKLKKAENKFNISEVNSLKEVLSKIESGNSSDINSRAKKLVLIDFFNKYILDGKEKIFDL